MLKVHDSATSPAPILINPSDGETKAIGDASKLIHGCGKMADLARNLDWHSTALGAVQSWSETVQTCFRGSETLSIQRAPKPPFATPAVSFTVF